MKLRTEMRDNGCDSGKHLVADGDWYYDAACAHALKLATWGIPKRYRDWVEYRADEIMAGWGFDSGEVEGGH